MEKIFYWVTNSINMLTIAVTGKDGNRAMNILHARTKDSDGIYIQEAPHQIEELLKTLVTTDDGCRKFIFRHLFRMGLKYYMLRQYVDPYTIAITPALKSKLSDDETEAITAILMTIIFDLDDFYHYVRSYCQEWGNDVQELIKPCDPEGDVYEELHKYYEGCLPQRQEEQPKYKQLERSHRIAAVKMLLDSTGVSKGIDKTKIAAFVEAVTGGNIETKPQDTVSYKPPTNPAKEAAAAWLAKIGIK